MSLWDEVKKNVVELYAATSDKTTEIAKVSSRRWDKFGISRDIERQFGELGNLVYTALKEGDKAILEHESVAVLMARIEALEEELRKKDEEIGRIQREHKEHKDGKARKAAAGGAAAGSAHVQEDDDTGDSGVVMKDPALVRGRGESAILVEPGETDDSEADEDESK